MVTLTDPKQTQLFLIRLSCIAIVALALPSLAFADTAVGYLRVDGPCHLTFPDDHGAHPGYRTEWWYYTGNLRDENDRPFGFQFTVFRYQIAPLASASHWPQPTSRWRSPDVYMAHIAVTDMIAARYLTDESRVRGALNMAGVNQNSGITTVFVRNWQVRISGETHRINAQGDGFGFDLVLASQKPPVSHGNAGYSLKGSAAHQASCYYSLTRLATEGILQIGNTQYTVTGTSWMDHEFSTAPLDSGISGWDWFSLQLDNRTELMLYLLRLEGGGLHSASSGTLVEPSGDKHHLTVKQFVVGVAAQWQSPHTGGRYPSKWTVSIPARSIDLKVRSNLADQEMRTPDSTGVTYWEGSVSVAGTVSGASVSGHGYVELTGYAARFDAPL